MTIMLKPHLNILFCLYSYHCKDSRQCIRFDGEESLVRITTTIDGVKQVTA